ncbi:hemicentin-1-like [Mytilus edulis]|uniref:hemicentin-1-like n=1 Tax=Mytilus edulis TaxID=6550 RepID=UPI0039EF3F87
MRRITKLLWNTIVTLSVLGSSSQNTLLFSTSDDIKELDLDSGNVTVLASGVHYVFSMDYDYIHGFVYFSRYYKNDILRFNYTFVENITLETVIVTEHYPVGVAIDPVDYHVYWTETFSSSRRIRRCNFDGTNPVVLINEKSPWTISLDLINRWIYFGTVIGTIGRFEMNGTYQETIIANGIGYVSDLSIDTNLDYIYWIEYDTGDLKSADINSYNVSYVYDGNSILNITSDSPGVYGSKVTDPSLSILHVTAEVSGDYICFPVNIVGTGNSEPTSLTVLGEIPTVTIKHAAYNTTYGYNVTLECMIVSSPNHTHVYWQHIYNETVLNITSDSPGVYGSKVTDPSLTILHVTIEDSGDYICFAVNIVGTGNSEPTSLTVLGEIPTVTIKHAAYNTTYGFNVTIECMIVSSPNHTHVYWQHIYNETVLNITSESPGVYGSKVTDPSLTILHVTAEDSGDYICFAVNIVGTGNSEPTSLTVLGEIPTVTIKHAAYNTTYGFNVTLECMIVSSPNHTHVYWQHIYNETVLNITSESPGVYGSKVTDPSLTILHVTAEDSGDYICFAVNIVGTGNSEPTSLTVLGEIPTVTIKHAAYNTTYGFNVTLECMIVSSPNHTHVYWQHIYNETVLNITSDSPGVYGSKVTDPSLTILHVTAEDSGDYICFAVNIVGTGNSEPTSLTVLGEIPTVTIKHAAYNTTYGFNVTLECMIVSSPNHTHVYWQHIYNETVLNITSESPGVYGSKVTDPSLTILHVTAEDSGDYICFAVNIVGTGNSEPTSLTVLGEIPTVTIKHAAYNTTYGFNVTLECMIVSSPNHTHVYWQHIYNETVLNITSDSPGVYGSKVTDPSLTILHVTAEDSGDYICFAVNIVGTGNSEPTSLTVLGEIPTVTIKHAAYNTTYGFNVTLECMIVSSPNHTHVYWQHIYNETVLNITSDSPGVYGSKVTDPSLTILHVTAEDSGDYICFAVNIVGTGNSEPTSLTVLGEIPTVTIKHAAYNTTYGLNVTLECMIVSSPNHTHVYWQHIYNETVLNITSDSPGVYGSKVTDPSLTILHVTAEDSGDYICFAVNIVGTGNSEPTSLTVLGEIPTVTIKHAAYNTTYGFNVTLECMIVSSPNHTHVYWQHIYNETVLNITSDSPGVYGSKVTDPSLTILHVTAKDSGDYICFAVNIVGTGNSEPTSLTVLGEIPTVTIKHAAYNTTYGFNVTLECMIVSSPNHTHVYWQHIYNETVLNITSDSPGVYGSKVTDPSLTILHVTAEDSGDYICFAVNIVGTGNSEPTSLTVLGEIPTVTIKHAAYNTTYGFNVTLECMIVSSPNHTHVYWQHIYNETVLNITSDSPGVYGSKVTDPSLTILHVTAEDSGDYICFAVNIVGTGNSEPTSLTVLGEIPTVTIKHAAYNTTYGFNVTLECMIVSSPNHTHVYWQHIYNETVLNITSDSPGVYGSKVTDPSLTILHVTAEDSGDYICFAVNIVGTGNSEPTSLTVLGEIPTVTIKHAAYNTTYGFNVTLECMIVSSPNHTHVYWQHIYNETVLNITSDSPGVYGSKVTDPSLTILHVTAEDSGDYICFAVNIVGTGNSEPTSLTVLGEIPTVTIKHAAYNTTYGFNVTLECMIVSSPNHTHVYWQHIYNETVLNITSDSPGVYGSKVTDPSLTILHVTAEDSGDYICFAVNIVGTGNSEPTSLTVLGEIPTVTIKHAAYNTTYGFNVTLECMIVSSPNHTHVYWQHIYNETVLNITSDSPGVYGSKVTDPSLTILHVTAEDSGDYICFAVNIVGTGNSEPTSLTVLGEIPTVTIKHAAYNTTYGFNVTLECMIVSSPNHTHVYWQHIYNETVLNITSDSPGVYGSKVTDPSLTILHVTAEDSGDYICFAVNIVGTGNSEPTSLTVLGEIPTVTIKHAAYNTTYGFNVTLECMIVSSPNHTHVYWQHIYNETVLNITSDSPGVYGSKVTDPSLTILHVTAEDSGDYICFAVNIVGTGNSEPTSLTVLGEIPTVTIKHAAYNTTYGFNVTLECMIVSSPNHTHVYWQHIYNETVLNITSDSPGVYDSKVTDPSLTILHVTAEDSGDYICFAVNIVGTGNSEPTSLTVLGEIPTVTIKHAAYNTTYGFNVTLECMIVSSPNHTHVYWQHIYNETVLNITSDSPGVYGSKVTDPSLTILHVTAEDSGDYICFAVNIVGTGNSEPTSLTVLGEIPTVTIKHAAYNTTYGFNVTLECMIVSSPNHTHVYWQHIYNETVLNITCDSPGVYGSKVTDPSLTILHVTAEDSGDYICFAVNIVGTGNSEPTSLTVLGEIPTVTIKHAAYNTTYGFNVTLECMIVSSPNHTHVYWQHIYNETVLNITSDSPGVYGSKVTDPSLTILHVTAEDSGDYICFAVNIVGTGNSEPTSLTVLGEIPTVTIKHAAYNTTYGFNVTLECMIVSSLNHTHVYWQHIYNETVLNITSDSPGVYGSKVTDPSLTILHVTAEDSGDYICFAVNIVGTGNSEPTSLTVLGEIPTVTIKHAAYNTTYGFNVTLECMIVSSPNHTHVYWQHIYNETVLNITSDSPGVYGSKVTDPSLTILHVTAEDSGDYICFAVNIVGTGNSEPTSLTVLGEIPTVTIKHAAYNTTYGFNVTLECMIVSSPNHTHVYWQHIYNETVLNITSDSPGVYGSKVTDPSLTILHVTAEDSGDYICFAVNIVGTGNSEPTSLTVLGEIPTVTIKHAAYNTTYGFNVTLECMIVSSPNHTHVYWQHIYNETVLNITSDSPGVYGSKVTDPSLTILHVTAEDSGDYICFAVNIVGTGNSEPTSLTVLGEIPTVTIKHAAYNTTYGFNVTLECMIVSSPNHTHVYWQHIYNETVLNITSDSPGVYGSKVTDPSLTILHVTAEDSGDYICFAVNIVGTGNSEPTSLTVLGEIPTVTIKHAAYNTTYGFNVTLECMIVSSLNHTHVYWQHIYNETVLNITCDSPGVYGSKVTDPSLTILHVTAEDSGDYICFAVNIVGTGNSEPTSLTVLGEIPTVTIKHAAYNTTYGFNVTLECIIVSFPNHTHVYWQHIYNETVLNITSDSPGVYGSKVTDPSLTILHVTAEDSGDYICFAVNIVGTGNSEPTSLTVLGEIPTVTIKHAAYNTTYGFNVTLECMIVSSPNHTHVYWQHIYNETVLNITSDSPGVYGSKVTDPSLTILHVTAEDSGDYICFAVNIVGTGNSEPTSLTVLGEIPTVTIKHAAYNTTYGFNVTLECMIVSSPNHTHVYWQHIYNETVLNITSDSPGVYGSKVTDPSLTILHVTAEDSGDYICFAVNIVGTGNSEPTSLTVLGEIPTVTIKHAAYNTTYGFNVTLECMIVSSPNHTHVYWQHIYNETVLNITSDSPGVYGSKVTDLSLTILHVTAEDSGDYICFAVNIVGTGNSEPTSLTVLGGIHLFTFIEPNKSWNDV